MLALGRRKVAREEMEDISGESETKSTDVDSKRKESDRVAIDLMETSNFDCHITPHRFNSLASTCVFVHFHSTSS